MTTKEIKNKNVKKQYSRKKAILLARLAHPELHSGYL